MEPEALKKLQFADASVRQVKESVPSGSKKYVFDFTTYHKVESNHFKSLPAGFQPHLSNSIKLLVA